MSTTGADEGAAKRPHDRGPSNVLFDAWLVSRSVHQLIDTAIAESGLDADEFAVYSVLASSDGLTPSELAHWMAAATTTVSSYVKRFERRNHVTRIPNAEDGRSYRLQLTDAGREAHQHAGALFAPVLTHTEQTLGTHAQTVHTQLLELLRAVDATRDDYA
jgi:DNA-binding MarR family transcriptional regulator